MSDGLPGITFQDCPHKDWPFSRQMAWSQGYNEALAKCLAAPIDMLMFCPKCGAQHVDRADEAQGWTNPPHATHTCQRCGLLWRPSNAYTNGVAILPAEEAKHVERIAATWPGGHRGVQSATVATTPYPGTGALNQAYTPTIYEAAWVVLLRVTPTSRWCAYGPATHREAITFRKKSVGAGMVREIAQLIPLPGAGAKPGDARKP